MESPEIASFVFEKSPNQRIPNQRVPNQRIPNQRIPNQRIPNQRIPNQRVPNQRIPNQRVSVPNQPESGNNGSYMKIFIAIVVILILVSIGYLVYKNIDTIYEKIQIFGTGYYMPNAEEESAKAAKCKSGCDKGVCEVGKGECKSNADCEYCVDNKGGFYGKVETSTSTTDKNAKRIKILEEEDAAQDRRIRELELMIQERNKQIAELNRYIEYVNRIRNRNES